MRIRINALQLIGLGAMLIIQSQDGASTPLMPSLSGDWDFLDIIGTIVMLGFITFYSHFQIELPKLPDWISPRSIAYEFEESPPEIR